MSDEIEIKIRMKVSSYRKLESQMKFLKKLKMPELDGMNSVADLITFYLDHISLSHSQFDDAVSSKIEEIFNTLNKKGLTYQSIMDAFSSSNIVAETEELIEDEELDDETTIKPKVDKKS